MFGFGPQITLVTRTVTGQDADGNDVYGETTTTVQGVFAPGGSAEYPPGTGSSGGDQVISQPTVYLPLGTSLAAVDAVEVGGVRYEVDGDPLVWASPSGSKLGGVQVPLRKVTG